MAKRGPGRPSPWKGSTVRTQVWRPEESFHEPLNRSSVTSKETSVPECDSSFVPPTYRSTTNRCLPRPLRSSPLSLSLSFQISDLLKSDRTNLLIREDKKKGVYVEGLSEWVVRSPAEIYGLMERGGAIRATGETKMNEMSSRSHAVFIVIVEQSETIYVDDRGNEVTLSLISALIPPFLDSCQRMNSIK